MPLWRRARTRGFPPSGNGASSFHLGWRLPRGAGHLVEAGVTLEVLTPPAVDHLYFWALQVAFPGAGAAHLGLQWNDRHPDFGAVNWGGYAADGSLLAGTEPSLASTPGDPNTRDYDWVPERAYRLAVRRAGEGLWRGRVTDLATGDTSTVRDLIATAPFLGDPMVWSEVFARCDDPSVTARWSDFEVVTDRGDRVVPAALTANYQSHADGGCANTASVADDRGGVLQITNTDRVSTTSDTIRFPR
ncbi:MAG TPA: hypothetical protein VKH36_01360 [Acidimicrobiia bacterium]|nr:hypothetical protein [Acidimicrobiia bacterium]